MEVPRLKSAWVIHMKFPTEIVVVPAIFVVPVIDAPPDETDKMLELVNPTQVMACKDVVPVTTVKPPVIFAPEVDAVKPYALIIDEAVNPPVMLTPVDVT